MQEAGCGNEEAADLRLEKLEVVRLLGATSKSLKLAKSILDHKLVPQNVVEDVAHIAIATANGMDHLLTWNLKHIANAVIRGKVEALCRSEGYEPHHLYPRRTYGGTMTNPIVEEVRRAREEHTKKFNHD